MPRYPILATLRNSAHRDAYVPSALVLDVLTEIEASVRNAARECSKARLHGIALELRALARQLVPIPTRKD